MMILSTLLLPILVGLSAHHGMVRATNDNYLAPLYEIDDDRKISNHYIVMLELGHTLEDHWRAVGADLSTSAEFMYFRYFSGYHAKLSTTALTRVRRDPNVSFVETNRFLQVDVHRHADARLPSDLRAEDYALPADMLPMDTTSDVEDVAESDCGDDTGGWYRAWQSRPPWNLGAISAAGKLDRSVIDNGTAPSYIYLGNAGRGVDIYVLDSGINIEHEQFGGRASNIRGQSSLAPTPYMYEAEPLMDTKNHGTGVASVAVGDTLGVAKSANVINVRILPGPASNSSLAARTTDYVLAMHDVAKAHNTKCDMFPTDDPDFRGSIMSCSFSLREKIGLYDNKHGVDTLERCLGILIRGGIDVVASSGNFYQENDNRYTWPCNSPGVICVGGINETYEVPDFINVKAPPTNFYLAPCEGIRTADYAGADVMRDFSGASYAAPIVAGIAATFISYMGLAAGGVDEYLSKNALKGICTRPDGNLGHDQNRLANTGINNPDKAEDEPFRGATKERVIHRAECVAMGSIVGR